MAFDPNSMPKDLRPLNLARTMPEETRIAPVTTLGRDVEGFCGNPPREVISPGSTVPVYYPVAAPDAGFVGLGYSNAVPGIAGWSPRMPTAAIAVAAPDSNVTTGYRHNPNLGTRAGSGASDYTSDEGGEDSVTGKKVKFLCSFGGKILPRPSDGKLRYVGGQTRIISVRRDVSFNELVQKMIDVYGQNVIIKYQLPDEDLDALVSVSCSDDLQNMMDEYEKLVASSSDGLAKLRVFLFSPSEFDPWGMVQFSGLQDSGQKYFEAVNGIMDGVGSIARKESIASASSTQNSDLSGTEAIDSSVHGQGDVTGLPYTGISPKANSAAFLEPASRLVCVNPSAAIFAEASSQKHTPRSACVDPTSTMYAEASNAPLGIPVVMSAPPPTLSSQPEHELERSMPVTVQKQQIEVDLQQPGVNFQPSAPYLQAYADPHQETLNHADYGNSQMGFPTHLLGTVGHVFTHPQFHENAGVSSCQFVPAVHMTITPASRAIVKPNMVLPLVHPQHIQLERHPDDGTFGARVVQLPADQSYNAYQAQVPPAVVGGGYGWNQVPQKEHVVFSEGWIPHQQVKFPENIAKFEHFYVCEKASPHADSDTVVQDQRENPTGTVPDLNSAYHGLQLGDKMRVMPMNRAVVNGAPGEGIAEQRGAGAQPKILSHIIHETGKPRSEAAGASQNVMRQFENDRIILQKPDNPDHPKVSYPQGLVGLTDGMQSPYGRVMATLPQPCHENAVQQLAVSPQHQVKKEALMSKSVHSDIHPGGGVAFQMPDHQVNESPKDYSTKVLGIPSIEDPVESYVLLKQIDGRMENLQICPSEVFINNKQSKSPNAYPRKEDIEARPLQIAEREPYLENTFSKPSVMLDMNHVKPNEVLPSTNEDPYLHNFQPLESSEGLCGNLAFPGVDSALSTERTSTEGQWGDKFQPNVLPGDVDIVTSYGNTSSSLSPTNRVGNVQDSPSSISRGQDPWNLQPDTHLPPPKPNKIAIRKVGFGTRDPSSESHLEISGELPMSSSAELTSGVQSEDGVYRPICNMNTDFGSEHTRTTQGSAEEIIKQEIQAVAVGIAASVLQPSMPSNPDLTMHERSEILSEANQDGQIQNTDVELQENNFEDIKTKLPEKKNLGFPVSDGIGRLQIIKNGDLEELRELGSGTFGTVYHGKWRGTDVAIKRINDRCFAGKPSEQDRMRYDFWNEAINLADLHHPNVVAFYGVVLDGPGGSVATVTEYMVNGSLRNALEKSERNLDKRKRLLIAMDAAFGMEYLHGKNIVHFDLKSDNLLVNLRDPHRPICKVGDLGLSKVKCHTLISGGVRGTLPWMAPELLNGSSSLVSEKVDVFSFGIVLWELLTGDEPYADLHYGAIIGGIVSNTLRPAVPECCDPEWRSLMERCWSPEPSERPSFTEIANQLRAMAAKIPPKAHAQQHAPSNHPQVKS